MTHSTKAARSWAAGLLLMACVLALAASPAARAQGADPSVHLRGVALAAQQSKLGFSQSGTLTLLPREGDRVRQGETIASIDEASAAVGLAKARAALANTQLTLDQAIHERGKTARLRQEEIVSEMAVEEAEFAVRQARAALRISQADLDAAQLAVDGCRIVAPFDGVVVALAANLGEFIGAGTPVMELADLTELELTMDVPPELVEELAEGTETDVLGSGERVVGTAVARTVMPFIDGASGLRRVIWNLTPNPGEVLAGRYLTLRYWEAPSQ